MREFRGKAAIIVGVLYFAFVAWSLYGALVAVEMYTFRMSLSWPWAFWPPRFPPRLDVGLAVLGVATIA